MPLHRSMKNIKNIPETLLSNTHKGSGVAFSGVGNILNMKLIKLNKFKENKHKDAPKFAQVDDEDFFKVNMYNWNAIKGDSCFYATAGIKNNLTGKRQMVQMHRFIMNLTDPKTFVDHADRNGVNNQKINLRIATHSQNNINRGFNKNLFSIYKGVTLKKTKHTLKHGIKKEYYSWTASIGFQNKKIHIGCFKNELDAALAYDKKAKELFGEFAYLNFKS